MFVLMAVYFCVRMIVSLWSGVSVYDGVCPRLWAKCMGLGAFHEAQGEGRCVEGPVGTKALALSKAPILSEFLAWLSIG